MEIAQRNIGSGSNSRSSEISWFSEESCDKKGRLDLSNDLL